MSLKAPPPPLFALLPRRGRVCRMEKGRKRRRSDSFSFHPLPLLLLLLPSVRSDPPPTGRRQWSLNFYSLLSSGWAVCMKNGSPPRLVSSSLSFFFFLRPDHHRLLPRASSEPPPLPPRPLPKVARKQCYIPVRLLCGKRVDGVP